MDMREQEFGIEIEMTGITRQRAAEVMAAYFSSVASYDGGSYEVYSVRDAAGRRWKVMYDSSIEAQKKGGGYAGSEYKVEFVSPICEYADIPVIQELIRQLRHAGAVAGKNTGIHVHINAAPHDARTPFLCILAIIVASALASPIAIPFSSIPSLKLHIVLTSLRKFSSNSISYSVSMIDIFSSTVSSCDSSAPRRRCNSYLSSCSGSSFAIPIIIILIRSIFPFHSWFPITASFTK